MFINNINPVLFQIGPIEVRYYGIIYALGFVITYLFLLHAAKNKKIKNLTEEAAESLLLHLIIGVVVFARLFEYIFYQPSSLFSNPLEIFFIWQGGLSFHGGLFGAILAAHYFCKKNKIKFYELADLIVLPAALALFLGRIANFLNSELVGTKTSVPWCVVFPKVDEACRHPSQLYESGKNLAIFFILYAMKEKKKLKDGILFWTFILLYGLLRFITNYWRDDPRWIFGISTGQALSLVLIPIAIYFLYNLNKEK